MFELLRKFTASQRIKDMLILFFSSDQFSMNENRRTLSIRTEKFVLYIPLALFAMTIIDSICKQI